MKPKQEVGLYLEQEGPNLGKSLFLGESNNSYVLQSSMAPELIFHKEELTMTTPRQLAPTVGPMMKGVEIMGAARRALEKLAIGRVYTDEHGETEIDDSGWTSEMNEVDEGYQLVFGGINVFVGMVSTSGIRSNSAESVSEPTVVIESDGEESVGTDRKSTRLNSSHRSLSRMPSSA